ncbi:MAG: type III-A CRISPR-associated RAMP protein Csm4 [Culturomica sp.]|jgi:CRISPR-associated protein Csm4|nr:type III-A CRISPR-associated RAMP protein Csm4 [Culturomica sp.]
MLEFGVYKLHFTTPVHLGDNREDYGVSLKTIQSDTMYAALTACLAKIGKTIPKDGDLDFTISSLFPFYQKDKDSQAVYFLPKPYKKVSIRENPDLDAKSLKKIQWLDIRFFEKYLNESTVDVDKKEVKGEYLTSCEIDKDFITSEVSPRVAVSRTAGEDARPFYMDRVFFKDYSGLYFIMGGAVNLLHEALDVLQYEGIGTDRNVGNGFFTYDTDEIEIAVPDERETDYALALSMFIPQSKEQLQTMLSGKDVGYDFMRRGGWLTTPPFNTFRKNAVYAFTPGSVFSAQLDDDVDIMGKIVNLKPDIDFGEQKLEHPVWRSGKSFFIPIKM